MLADKIAAQSAQPRIRRTLSIWFIHLGGPGLILLGLLDNSVIPLPGSMDALTIVLAAHQRQWWIYYAAMATIGAVLGGYVTFRLARKQGKDLLQRKIKHGWMKKVHDLFQKWGWGAIAIPAVLPPPVPMVPFLVVAGATNYPTKKFLAALSVGRAVRYTALAYLATVYGRQILRLFSQYGFPILYVLIGLAAVSASITIIGHYREKAASGSRAARTTS
ncbi:MAG TPA: VTT domain-containing protein [Candidatus Acidoferrales bacterium]|nr:VTT domain-containing protein [Candidatus Acidoferrales bacterium]